MSQQISENDQRDRFRKFEKWFEDTGGWISDLVEFKFTPERGVHLCVKSVVPDQQIASKTCILSCPHSLTLSALNAWHVPPLFASKTPSNIGHDRLELPQKLLDEARPQAIGALWLIAQRNIGEKSWWSPYINILPGVAPQSGKYTGAGLKGMGFVNAAIWWTEEEQSWVAGTNLEKGIAQAQEMYEMDWMLWKEEIAEWSSRCGWTITRTDFFWALSIFNSRAFPSRLVEKVTLGDSGRPLLEEEDPDMLLYPGIDMLNHDARTTNKWSHEADNFELICNDMPAAGSEVYVPYGAKSNAQFLLSYGFVLDRNPHDSLSLKLAQTKSPLLEYNHRTSIEADEEPKGPNMIPPGSDLEQSLFFVRPISGDIMENPSYPPEDGVNRHLLGFPYALLNILAADLEIPREVRARAEQVGQILDLRRSEPNRDRHIDVYAKLGQRNILAVTNILVKMLRFSLARMSAVEFTNKSIGKEPTEAGSIHHSRWKLCQVFRKGQRDILEDNIMLLSSRLEAALTFQKEFLPLGVAMAYFERVMTKTEWSELAQGIKAGLGVKTATFREILQVDAEEPAWALLLGVGMQLGRDQRRELHRFLKPADSGGYWFDLLAVRYHEDEESSADEGENAEAIRAVVQVIQQTLGAQGFWAESNWSDSKVDKLARIVGRETLRVSLARADVETVRLGAGRAEQPGEDKGGKRDDMDVDEDEGQKEEGDNGDNDEEQGEGVEIVAMFVQ